MGEFSSHNNECISQKRIKILTKNLCLNLVLILISLVSFFKSGEHFSNLFTLDGAETENIAKE
jgi:hypothetical protein